MLRFQIISNSCQVYIHWDIFFSISVGKTKTEKTNVGQLLRIILNIG